MNDPYKFIGGKYIQLPVITPEYRKQCKDLISKRSEESNVISSLLDMVDACEAVMRNMYRSLQLYRNNMPVLIRKLNEVKGGNK